MALASGSRNSAFPSWPPQKRLLRPFASICLGEAVPATPVLPAICSFCHNRRMKSNGGQSRSPENGALPTWGVFAVLLAFVAAGGSYLATRHSDSGQARGPTSPPLPSVSSHQMSDAEAISTFESIDRKRVQALETRDAGLAAALYVDGTAVEERILQDIRRLLRTDTRLELNAQTEALEVIDSTPQFVRLRQDVLIKARFTNRAGEEVGTAPAPERQTIAWTLENVGGSWLIEDAVVREAELIE